MSVPPKSGECPWFVSRHAVDDWRTVERRGGNLKMLKALKILRSIIVNLGVIVIASLALQSGGEPTVVGTTALLILGAYNGIEYSDYMALVTAIGEVRAEQDSGDDGS